MNDTLEIREVPMTLTRARKQVNALMEECGLQPDAPALYLGVYDADDELLGGAGLDGNIIKGVAVLPRLRGEAVVNVLLSRLLQIAYAEGHTNVFVFTKPQYRNMFESLAMHCIAACDRAVLLENNPRGVGSYCQRLSEIAAGGGEKRGVIVMNCNPLTLGHRYLIEQAAAQVDNLYIIPVREDVSAFSYEERFAMLTECCKDLPNVTVCPGSEYTISRATFPTYFLKDLTEASEVHIALDCDLFARHILPALGASVRIVGTEPTDALTRAYNDAMKRLLPCEVKEVQRFEVNGTPVSASRLRALITHPEEGDATALAHTSAVPYVLARIACHALEVELSTTPKPGLVDLHDNGAHKDMNPELMRRGIGSILPYFSALAQAGLRHASADEVRRIGIEAEHAMMKATGGINTHRGALFALGLALYAATSASKTSQSLSVAIKSIAEKLSENPGQQESVSHGTQARANGCVGGAMAIALTGYGELFERWLPFYRRHKHDAYAPHKTLLLIMSTLTDTNIAYRAGNDAAEKVRSSARKLLDNFSTEGLSALNKEFIDRNISPGGAADMLALTILCDAITDNKP